MATDADLQTVMNRFLPAYRAEHGLTSREAAVCHHIQSCRTAALGGVELHCGACDYQAPWYCACRDRHCPKCQWRATQAWCARQGAAVLPVTMVLLLAVHVTLIRLQGVTELVDQGEGAGAGADPAVAEDRVEDLDEARAQGQRRRQRLGDGEQLLQPRLARARDRHGLQIEVGLQRHGRLQQA